MSRTLTALAVASCLATGAIAFPGGRLPTASAAIGSAGLSPKIVIIVGPAGSATASYRSDAMEAAAEAAKHTTNVVTVYSPTATWAKAKAALQGASIVVYMGHGNGWPSPYPPFQPSRQDGIGLNPSEGTSDSTTQYWGEFYLASQVRLAPNAVVILSHLCYSAGNSEPGFPNPTLPVAQQRVDNMAAGWIAAGAGAVVADAYAEGMWGGAAWYINQLFTTSRSIDQIWRSSPNLNGHILSFPSTRSPGSTAQMDPDGVNAPPFRRAMVGRLDLQSQEVTGGGFAPTDGDPASFVVPGNASVRTDNAGLYADPLLTPDPTTGLAPSSLGLDTHVRIDLAVAPVNGIPAFAVHTLDGSQSGFMSASELVPRDSQGPIAWVVSAGGGNGAFSPNGDGILDVFDLAGQLSEASQWQVDFSTQDGSTLRTVTGSGATFDATWDGTVGGSPVPDGSYRYSISARDAWGNVGIPRSGTVTVDTVAPQFASALASAGAPAALSPNGDGVGDSVTLAYAAHEPVFVNLDVRDASGQLVRHSSTATGSLSGSVTWRGETDAGSIVPDGQYTMTMTPRDAAGNVGAAQGRTVLSYTSLSHVAASPGTFYPQDGDPYAPTTTVSFALSSPATVNATLVDSHGAPVAQVYAGTALAPGSYSWIWDGRTPAGGWAAPGLYRFTVTATDGVSTSTQVATVAASAFRITASASSPGRGQTITITAVSAETLTASPRLAISQPGHATWRVTMAKASGSTYRASLHLYSTGGAGSLKLSISGMDLGGQRNVATAVLPLH